MIKTETKINLNDWIKVKLTDHGKDIFYHRYDDINQSYGKIICKPDYPKVDKDGYTRFQLWQFMQLYGSHMKLTCENVICPFEIVKIGE